MTSKDRSTNATGSQGFVAEHNPNQQRVGTKLTAELKNMINSYMTVDHASQQKSLS